MIKQLALFSEIRKLFTTDMTFPDCGEVMRNTQILLTCQQLLNFNSNEEEAYFMKLEALWILTNLACTDDDDEAMLILASDLDPTSLQKASLDSLRENSRHGLSAILRTLNALIVEKMD